MPIGMRQIVKLKMSNVTEDSFSAILCKTNILFYAILDLTVNGTGMVSYEHACSFINNPGFERPTIIANC